MDGAIAFVLQVMLLGVLAAYLAVIAAAVYGAVWFAYRTLHDHLTVVQAWREASDRLSGITPR